MTRLLSRTSHGYRESTDPETGLTAEDRAFSPFGGYLLLGDHGQLVRRGERPPCRARSQLGSSRTSRTLGCLSDGVGTCTRISGPALPIRDSTLTRGVSRHPAREGRTCRRIRHDTHCTTARCTSVPRASSQSLVPCSRQ